jgi:hypothetical protein
VRRYLSNPKFAVVTGKVQVDGPSGFDPLPTLWVHIGTSFRAASRADGTFEPPVNFYPSEDVWVTVPIDGRESFGEYYVRSITYGSIDLLKDTLCGINVASC